MVKKLCLKLGVGVELILKEVELARIVFFTNGATLSSCLITSS